MSTSGGVACRANAGVQASPDKAVARATPGFPGLEECNELGDIIGRRNVPGSTLQFVTADRVVLCAVSLDSVGVAGNYFGATHN